MTVRKVNCLGKRTKAPTPTKPLMCVPLAFLNKFPNTMKLAKYDKETL